MTIQGPLLMVEIEMLRRALAGEAMLTMDEGLGYDGTDKALGITPGLDWADRYECLRMIRDGEDSVVKS